MLSNTYTMTNAALLVLTVGWFLIGVIITAMVASHLSLRASDRSYGRGWQNAADYYTSLKR